jgi:hypothetical protein
MMRVSSQLSKCSECEDVSTASFIAEIASIPSGSTKFSHTPTSSRGHLTFTIWLQAFPPVALAAIQKEQSCVKKKSSRSRGQKLP